MATAILNEIDGHVLLAFGESDEVLESFVEWVRSGERKSNLNKERSSASCH